MVFQVLKYGVFGDGTIGGRKVSPALKVPTPVTLLKLRELVLHPMRRAPFILRIRSATDSSGRIDANMWTWSLASTPLMIPTPFSAQTRRRQTSLMLRQYPDGLFFAEP